jgi:NADPH:quinone reductase-like Zn-dependent oxidoreductase
MSATEITRQDLSISQLRVEAARPYDPIGGSLASGKLKPIIAKTFPFEKIVDAHRFMESKR